MENYNKKAGWIYTYCEVCREWRECCQHHIQHRRYGEKVIHVCVKCHAKIHAEPAWAYKNGYLIKHNISYKITMKEVKKKTCEHTKTIGYPPVCLYCKKPVDTMAHGKKKTEHFRDSTKKIKMGSEQQDPRIKQIEFLKKELNKVTADIKKYASDKTLYEDLKKKKAEIKSMILKIKASYED